MTTRLKVFYDGLCPICSREINHYKKMKNGSAVEWLDLAAPGFDAHAYGLTEEALIREMHAITPDGRTVTGVGAFIEIWKHLDIFHVLTRVAQSPLARPFFNLGYRIFAKFRPRLSRHKAQCTTGRCAR